MSFADRIHARVGAEIRTNRISAGLRIDDIADKTNIPSADIERLENGIITLHWRRIEDIIDAIGLPMTSFVQVKDLPREAL